MTLEEKIRGCLERHPGWDINRICNSTGARQADVLAIKEGRALPTAPAISNIPSFAGAGVTPPTPDSGLISLEKVIQRYDIRSAILRELQSVPKGKLIAETELCQRAAGTDKYRFRRCVENNEAEFRGMRIKLRLDESGDGKWFWGNPADISAALQIRDV